MIELRPTLDEVLARTAAACRACNGAGTQPHPADPRSRLACPLCRGSGTPRERTTMSAPEKPEEPTLDLDRPYPPPPDDEALVALFYTADQALLDREREARAYLDEELSAALVHAREAVVAARTLLQKRARTYAKESPHGRTSRHTPRLF